MQHTNTQSTDSTAQKAHTMQHTNTQSTDSTAQKAHTMQHTNTQSTDSTQYALTAMLSELSTAPKNTVKHNHVFKMSVLTKIAKNNPSVFDALNTYKTTTHNVNSYEYESMLFDCVQLIVDYIAQNTAPAMYQSLCNYAEYMYNEYQSYTYDDKINKTSFFYYALYNVLYDCMKALRTDSTAPAMHDVACVCTECIDYDCDDFVIHQYFGALCKCDECTNTDSTNTDSTNTDSTDSAPAMLSEYNTPVIHLAPTAPTAPVMLIDYNAPVQYYEKYKINVAQHRQQSEQKRQQKRQQKHNSRYENNDVKTVYESMTARRKREKIESIQKRIMNSDIDAYYNTPAMIEHE
jgi:hypothetical protein